jgi:hypothetical protein
MDDLLQLLTEVEAMMVPPYHINREVCRIYRDRLIRYSDVVLGLKFDDLPAVIYDLDDIDEDGARDITELIIDEIMMDESERIPILISELINEIRHCMNKRNSIAAAKICKESQTIRPMIHNIILLLDMVDINEIRPFKRKNSIDRSVKRRNY